MKTSIKLLLIFVGIVGLLVLASDVVLWAYYKKGINGDGVPLKYPKDEITKEKQFNLKPFKALVVNAEDVRIYHSDDYRLGDWNNDTVSADFFKQVGDTVYILPVSGHGINVYCPNVPYIRLAQNDLHIVINQLEQPRLDMVVLDEGYVEFQNLKIGKLTYTGGKNNTILTHDRGNIDTMNMKLDWLGNINLQGILVKNLEVKADSLKGLNIGNDVLKGMEKFKRN